MNLSRQFRRAQERAAAKGYCAVQPRPGAETIEACAVFHMGECRHGFKSHRELRSSLGVNPDKELGSEGFWTNRGRYVSREAACKIGVDSGQLGPGWWPAPRKLLSSDIW